MSKQFLIISARFIKADQLAAEDTNRALRGEQCPAS